MCIVQLCEYVFLIGFALYGPKNGVFGDFEGEDVKLLSSNPQKTLPWVNTRLYVSRDKIGSTAWALGPWKDFAYKERNKKGGNFG